MPTLIDVSDIGRCRFHHNKFMTFGCKMKTGYMSISIRGKTYLVHRLVGFAFLSIEDYFALTIDHIDGIRSNNHVSNLEWTTMAEQRRRAAARATLNGGKKRNAPSNSRRVLVKRKCEPEWTSYGSMRELKRVLKMDSQKVGARLRGENPQYYADFEFKDEPYEVPFLEGETWKVVVVDGNTTTWQVSDFGRVKNKHGYSSHGVKQENGYMRSEVELYGSKAVHLLVAAAFLPPKPSSSHTIDHIDGNTTNNCVSNLQWVTQSEQISRMHALKQQKGISKPRANCRPIESAIKGTDNWERFEGINIAAKKLGVHRQAINTCLKNPERTAACRIFRTVELDSQKPILGETWKTLDLEKIIDIYIGASENRNVDDDEDVLNNEQSIENDDDDNV